MKQSIQVQELRDLIQSDHSIQVIDVRSRGEFDAGHVPQAVNIPLEQLESRLSDMKPGRIALLCQSGTRAGIACEMLQSHHQNLVIVEGGTEAWERAGLALVASTTNRWSLERQVRLGAGLLVLAGSGLAAAGFKPWIFLPMFVGAGLTFAGLTNICGMALLLSKLPWNRASLSQSHQQVGAQQS